jgi:hypothetical protein
MDPAPSPDPWRRIAYMLARHIDQVDVMPASTWSAKGQALLLMLRELAPERYDREIPPKRRRGQGERAIKSPADSSCPH